MFGGVGIWIWYRWYWYKQKMNLKCQNLSHFIAHFAQPIPLSEAYLPDMIDRLTTAH